MRRLDGMSESRSVVLDADCNEVLVGEGHESNRTVAQVLSAVQGWLEEAAVGSATVWLDDNRYTLAGRAERSAR